MSTLFGNVSKMSHFTQKAQKIQKVREIQIPQIVSCIFFLESQFRIIYGIQELN